MAISAGDLKKKVVLKVPTSSRNSQGSKEVSYAPLPEIRASIEQVRQQRALEVATVLLDTDRVVIRYSSITKDVNKNWRVSYDNKDHVIHTIEMIGEKQYIELLVKANG